MSDAEKRLIVYGSLAPGRSAAAGDARTRRENPDGHVLDLSGAALKVAQERLGVEATAVTWIEADVTRRIVCTIKFQGEINLEAQDSFSAIPQSQIVHLFQNKHELTFMWKAPA